MFLPVKLLKLDVSLSHLSFVVSMKHMESASGFVILLVYYNLCFVETGTNH